MPPVLLQSFNKAKVCVWMCTFVYLSIYEAYNLYSFVRLTVCIIFQKILYQIMYHNLGSKIVIILLIPNSTSNYKAGLSGDSVVKNPPANAGDILHRKIYTNVQYVHEKVFSIIGDQRNAV